MLLEYVYVNFLILVKLVFIEWLLCVRILNIIFFLILIRDKI